MNLLRERRSAAEARVESVELFFDLVFVFAVTQLSHSLLEDLSLVGFARVALLLLAVWWVWIYTTWVTNWLDPNRIPVRVCLFALMVAGVIMSAAIPSAFSEGGFTFAAAYVFMQVGRTLFFLWAIRGANVTLRRNFQRILTWLLLSSVFWIVGAAADADSRLWWWSLAFLIAFVSPWAYFWVPGLGRSTTAEWNIEGGHMAERCGLFVIIALGESVLIIGATYAGLPRQPATTAALVISVIGSILMWWIYFDTGAERARHLIVHAQDPGRHGRVAYTYLHAPIIAGILLSAVSDELVIAHPEHDGGITSAIIVSGVALYLLGNAAFKWATNQRKGPPLSHLVGLALLACLSAPALNHTFAPLTLAAMTTGVLALVAVWESIALRTSRASEPAPQH
jgi:low temperature requirement protein LtrA